MIYIEKLNFKYNNEKGEVIHNLNLHIEKGSYTSIMGENGSGKSTLIKLILGLIKPKGGSIKINTKKIAYVPQKVEGFNSDFPITVHEMLLFHLKALKLKDKNQINESLKTVNMLNYKESLIGELSGGQQQKIFIARSLIGGPELLILDEPSTGIDLKSQEEIYKIIKSLNKEKKVTVLSVEHNLNAALKNSTHIVKMDSKVGESYTIDEYKELLEQEENEELIKWTLKSGEHRQCSQCIKNYLGGKNASI